MVADAGKEEVYHNQMFVFNDVGKGVLKNAYDGFNTSLFAYVTNPPMHFAFCLLENTDGVHRPPQKGGWRTLSMSFRVVLSSRQQATSAIVC